MVKFRRNGRLNEIFSVKCAPHHREFLEASADRDGVGISDIIRGLIDKEMQREGFK